MCIAILFIFNNNYYSEIIGLPQDYFLKGQHWENTYSSLTTVMWLLILSVFVVISLVFILNLIKEKQWKSKMTELGGNKDIQILKGDWPILGHLPTLISFPNPDNHFPEHQRIFKQMNTQSYIIKAPGIPSRVFMLTIDPGSYLINNN